MKCHHCGKAGDFVDNRCGECAGHGHAVTLDACLCQVANAPGIVGAVPMDVLVAVK